MRLRSTTYPYGWCLREVIQSIEGSSCPGRSESLDGLNQGLPATVPSLIEAALSTFDTDRDSARRYLVRASEILHLRHGPNANTVITRPPESQGGLLAWQLNRVIDYIDMHLAEKVTANALADLINVSTGYLFRAFKISVGVPPFHYIGRRRVELACTMMSTTREPLSRIAIACGLCDQAHLCKVFRRMIGLSPSAWRRAMPARDAAKSRIIEVTALAPAHQRGQAAKTFMQSVINFSEAGSSSVIGYFGDAQV